jgi:hypothetical protein
MPEYLRTFSLEYPTRNKKAVSDEMEGRERVGRIKVGRRLRRVLLQHLRSWVFRVRNGKPMRDVLLITRRLLSSDCQKGHQKTQSIGNHEANGPVWTTSLLSYVLILSSSAWASSSGPEPRPLFPRPLR